MENLPTDIIEDIFSRVPVAPTLLECKRVSKTWRELLKRYKTGVLFAYKSEGKTQLYYGDQDEVTLESYYSNKTLARFEHVKSKYSSMDYMVGSCNGLVCLLSGICNPVTGEFLSFSDTHPIFSLSQGIGFGYLPLTNEYKVVGLGFSKPLRRGYVQVYTLGSRSGWRRTEDIPYDFDKPGIFANGAIHWMCIIYEKGRRHEYKISAFDLADEKFKCVPSPPLHNPFLWQNGRVEFELLGGNLCICHNMRSPSYLDIWAFKKNTVNISSSTVKCGDYYDDNWSWTRDYRLPDTLWTPFSIRNNNELITRGHREQLHCYNANTSTITKSWDGGEKGTSCLRAIPHINTLVSLKELGACSGNYSDEGVKDCGV